MASMFLRTLMGSAKQATASNQLQHSRSSIRQLAAMQLVPKRSFSEGAAPRTPLNPGMPSSGDIPLDISQATGREYQEVLFRKTFQKELHDRSAAGGPFGTLWAPAVIYSHRSSRIVGCLGGHNDSLPKHDLMWFVLHRGRKHMCGLCGQVFKLSGEWLYDTNYECYEAEQAEWHRDFMPNYLIEKFGKRFHPIEWPPSAKDFHLDLPVPKGTTVPWADQVPAYVKEGRAPVVDLASPAAQAEFERLSKLKVPEETQQPSQPSQPSQQPSQPSKEEHH